MFKDSVITARRKRRELAVALVCFGLAVLINVYSIIRFNCPWSEFFTQIGFVILLAACIYAVLAAVRLAVHAVVSIVRRCRG
ncbi:MAG: hypothetical protein MJY44_01805 [Bacteroidales bacterium]|nr:hypothetical protein [Bacteroidales bacterium]